MQNELFNKDYRPALPGKNWDYFQSQQPVAATWIASKAGSNSFANSLLSYVDRYGNLTEKQLAAALRAAQQDADAAERERQRLETAAAYIPPVVNVDKIVKAMQHGKEAGLKWVSLRFDGIVMREAQWKPGVLNVFHSSRMQADGRKAFLGKIEDGKFIAFRACTPEDQAAIILICEDPFAAALVYGNRSKRCCVCGKTLTNNESMELGIGPVCGRRMGWIKGGTRIPAMEA